MKSVWWVSAGLAAAVVVLAPDTSDAAGWGRKKFQHADKNKDGHIGPVEARMENRLDRRLNAKVNTPWEAKADKNNDGVVGPAEAAAARAVVDRKWETVADTDGNGKVSLVELRSYHMKLMDKNGDGKIDPEERRAFWLAVRSKVNTPLERKYDADKDGWISGQEAQEMLRDRLTLINTQGKAKVDTELERQYDANADGVIDAEEAKALKATLGL